MIYFKKKHITVLSYVSTFASIFFTNYANSINLTNTDNNYTNTQTIKTNNISNSLKNKHSLLKNISFTDNSNELLNDGIIDKSPEFFKRKITHIFFKDLENNDIKIVVNSAGLPGREENIDVYKNAIKYEFNSVNAKEILSMNRSFHDFSAESIKLLLDIINYNKENSPTVVTDYVDYIEGYSGMAKNNIEKQKLTTIIREIIEKQQNIERIIIPIKQGKAHWLSVVIDFSNKINTTITVINSTNQASKMSLDNIKNEYEKFLLPIIKDSIIESGLTLNNTFNFAQYLQYGNMGCGITMSLFIEELLNNNFKLSENEIFRDSDYTDNKLSKDKSGRSSLVLEAIRRVQLAIAIEKSEGF